MRRRSQLAAALTCGLAAVVGLGCGSSSGDYKNTPKPPSPIVVSASIDNDTVDVSPKHFGAGPITLVITNQSSSSQQVTLETADTSKGPGVRAVQTGPINPRETAHVNATVTAGTYALRVTAGGVKEARLVVGRQRASAQNDLLQP
jgi:hypothetical protein